MYVPFPEQVGGASVVVIGDIVVCSLVVVSSVVVVSKPHCTFSSKSHVFDSGLNCKPLSQGTTATMLPFIQIKKDSQLVGLGKRSLPLTGQRPGLGVVVVNGVVVGSSVDGSGVVVIRVVETVVVEVEVGR